MASIEAHANGALESQALPQGWRLGVDVIAALALLGTTLVALTASLSTAGFAATLWQAMPILFGIVALGLSWLYRGADFVLWKAALREAAGWGGVYLGILMLQHLAGIGQFTVPNAGFACAVLMALGTFLSGVHGQWRLLPVAAAMGAGTTALAILEHNMWLLLGIGLLGIGLVVLVGRLQTMVESR